MNTYPLEMTLAGANIILEIKDSAKWAPAGSRIAFTAQPGNFPRYHVTIQDPFLELHAEGQNHVVASVSASIKTSSDQLILEVINDGTISVSSPVDDFLDQVAGKHVRTLKLKRGTRTRRKKSRER